MNKPKLNLSILRQAVNKADDWKGALSAEDYPHHNAMIKRMRDSLRAVSIMKSEHAFLLYFVHDLAAWPAGAIMNGVDFPDEAKRAREALAKLGITGPAK